MFAPLLGEDALGELRSILIYGIQEFPGFIDLFLFFRGVRFILQLLQGETDEEVG